MAEPRHAPLVLDGESLELVSVAIDGRALASSQYKVDGAQLTIAEVPEAFALETVVRFDPWKNTKLEGLYGARAASSPNARRKASGASPTSSIAPT